MNKIIATVKSGADVIQFELPLEPEIMAALKKKDPETQVLMVTNGNVTVFRNPGYMKTALELEIVQMLISQPGFTLEAAATFQEVQTAATGELCPMSSCLALASGLDFMTPGEYAETERGRRTLKLGRAAGWDEHIRDWLETGLIETSIVKELMVFDRGILYMGRHGVALMKE